MTKWPNRRFCAALLAAGVLFIFGCIGDPPRERFPEDGDPDEETFVPDPGEE